MPNKVTITSEFINLGKSIKGGYTKPQLKLLGISWPPESGWKKSIIGSVISSEDVSEFIRLNKQQNKE